jgi:hypothetical protein
VAPVIDVDDGALGDAADISCIDRVTDGLPGRADEQEARAHDDPNWSGAGSPDPRQTGQEGGKELSIESWEEWRAVMSGKQHWIR